MLGLVSREMKMALMMMGKSDVAIGRDAVIAPQEFLDWPNA